MTRITRRRFVQLIGSSVVAVHLPPPVIASGLPRLVGDGVHNDAPALSALLRREAIEIGPLVDVDGAGWVGNVLTMPIGRFRLTEPITLSDVHGLAVCGQKRDGKNMTVLSVPPNSGGFRLSDCTDITLENLAFAMDGADMNLWEGDGGRVYVRYGMRSALTILPPPSGHKAKRHGSTGEGRDEMTAVHNKRRDRRHRCPSGGHGV